MFDKLKGFFSRKKGYEETTIPSPEVSEPADMAALEKGATKQRPAAYASEPSRVKALHELLNNYFSMDEIEDICLELSVGFDQLRGDTKSAKARELVRYYQTKNRLPQLATVLQARRPDLSKDIPLVTGRKPRPIPYEGPPVDQSSLKLIRLIRQNLSIEEIQSICQALNVPYTLIRGGSLETKSREMVLYFQRRGTVPNLIVACEKKRPDVDWLADAPTQYDSGYSIAAIRQLIEEIFADDEAIVAFCQVHFPDVLIEFGSGMSFQAKITRFVDYCRRRQVFTQLLPALQEIDVAIYERLGPYE